MCMLLNVSACLHQRYLTSGCHLQSLLRFVDGCPEAGQSNLVISITAAVISNIYGWEMPQHYRNGNMSFTDIQYNIVSGAELN